MIVDYDKIRAILRQFFLQFSSDEITFILAPEMTYEDIDNLLASVAEAVEPEAKEIDLSPEGVRASLDMIAYNHVVRSLADEGFLHKPGYWNLYELKGILEKRLGLHPEGRTMDVDGGIDVMKIARNLLDQCEMGVVVGKELKAAYYGLVEASLDAADQGQTDTATERARLRGVMKGGAQ